MDIKNAPETGGIYIIKNTETGRKYVGKTNNFRTRWTQHYSQLEKGVHVNRYLQKDWNSDKFSFLVYQELENEDERCTVELNLILGDKDGYNISKTSSPTNKRKPLLKPTVEVSWEDYKPPIKRGNALIEEVMNSD